ncbi:cell division protein ZipA [Gilvimarinus polysaccharolyticus]|uniref:cell division protein ZipA n=1 Tax=Gilvimarinus polysaccharolyticus TaxID=863921 RepID=UPI000673666F|nr:cell division protein ZipA [Gilvimarinus polysaccharolyticus]
METWLTIIVVLLIVGILLDGWRRMRTSRRDAIRVSKRVKRFDTANTAESFDEPFTSELPNGGARIAPRGERDTDGDDARPSSVRVKHSIPQQVTLNLDESVPMLMESVDDDSSSASQPAGDELQDTRVEPNFGELDGSSHQDNYQDEDVHADIGDEPSLSDHDDSDLGSEQPDEVIIINVMAPEGHNFSGAALLDVLLQSGMRFGDMNIFHRHAHETGEGPVLFSLANMVKPGVFDLENMASFYTPGVSLFMTLPMRPDSLKSFDLMRDVAQALTAELGGELKDENRSVMTRQTMEHCRQRIADYERKRLSRAGS